MNRLESHEQRDIVGLLERLGMMVYVIDQGGRSPSSRRTPGVFDLEVMHPAFGLVKIEVKKPKTTTAAGRVRANQQRYKDNCAACRIPTILGDLTAVYAWLQALGACTLTPDGHVGQLNAGWHRGTVWPEGLPLRPVPSKRVGTARPYTRPKKGSAA